MAQIQPTSIFHQVQTIVAQQLNADETLSSAGITFFAENNKDLDYEIKNALGRQGIVGIIMTPEAQYIGSTVEGELAYDLRDFTVQIVENPPVNRGLSASITALDAAQIAQDLLSNPQNTKFGVMNPVSIEQGEDSGLIVCQAKFNCNIHIYRTPDAAKTRAKYTAASGLPDWEGDIVGELGADSIPDKAQLESVDIGTHVTSIGWQAFSDCTNLSSVTIPDTVTKIYEYAFGGSGIVSVVLPSSVEDIRSNAFTVCTDLTQLKLMGKTMEQIQAMDNYPWGISNVGVIEGETQALEWIAGGYRSDGTTTPGVFYSPDYIPVEKNHNITWKWGDINIGASVHCYLMTYNADKQITSYWTPNGATGQRTVNVGPNTTYLRYSVLDGFQDTTFVKDETTGQYLVKNGKILL